MKTLGASAKKRTTSLFTEAVHSLWLVILLVTCYSATAHGGEIYPVNARQPVPLVLTAKIHMLPSNQDGFLALAQRAVVQTRQEPGCISYELFVSPDDPSTFIFVEEWQSQAALQAHLRQPYVKALLDAVRQGASKRGQIRIYTVTETAYALPFDKSEPQ